MKLFKLVILLAISYFSSAQTNMLEENLIKKFDILKLNNTLVCKNILKGDSLSIPIDTFYLQIGSTVILNNTMYNSLNWGKKGEVYGNVRYHNNAIWYLPNCEKYNKREYKLFDFMYFKTCDVYCLDGFSTKHSIRLKDKKYQPFYNDFLLTYTLKEEKPSFGFFLEEITLSYSKGIERMLFYFPHNENKYMECLISPR